MKRWITLVLTAALAGCATTGSDTSLNLGTLRDENNMRDRYRFPMTYPQIQQALLRHQQLCGSGPVFSLNQRSVNDARIVQHLSDPPRLARTVLVDMERVMGWDGERIVATAYAQYQVSNEEVARVFQAVLNPETCPGS